jgi:hypothetical protein
MRLIYATHLKCNYCGSQAQVIHSEGNNTRPEDPPGWVSTFIQDATGSITKGGEIVDICPTCTRRPFGVVMQFLTSNVRS